jgi:4-hydroxymandelate oxidase
MDIDTVRQTAREKLGKVCRVCPVCNGIVCAGEVPGMGGRGTGRSFRNNVEALAGYRINMRTVHGVTEPRLSCRILGLDLALPVIAAPISGVDNMNFVLEEEEYSCAVVQGCQQAGTIAMTGDGPAPEEFDCAIKAIHTVGGYGIPVIKPRKSDAIIEMAKRAADAGAPAFGVDIDAAAFPSMLHAGYCVNPKTVDELAKIKKMTPIPFIVKGIMTPEDAAACCSAGVDAIVVSNHGGRVLDHVPGTAEVMADIWAAVGGKITILVDGGIRSGVDVLKMLALGADAVLIGRPITVAAVGGQAQGVALALAKLADGLRTAMLLTGTADVADVSPDVIY